MRKHFGSKSQFDESVDHSLLTALETRKCAARMP